MRTRSKLAVTLFFLALGAAILGAGALASAHSPGHSHWDTGPVRESPPGSGTVVGTEPPPYENLPNRSGEDPHGAPRAGAFTGP